MIFPSMGPVRSCSLQRLDQTYLIGRDAACDIVLDDELVSRTHARIRRIGKHWQIEDCGSRNRLKINQIGIEKATLVNGDLLRIGDSILLFTADDVVSSSSRTNRPVSCETATITQIPMQDVCHPGAGSMVELFSSRDKRQSGLLGKLATLSHIVQSPQHLFELAIKTLQDGIGAVDSRVWLRGREGRLQLAAQSDDKSIVADSSLFASLAVENSQGVVFGDGLLPDTEVASGGAVAAIIPGTSGVRGAIECLPCDERSFSVNDLEFLIAVCNVSGMSLQNLEHRRKLETVNETLGQQVEPTVPVSASPGMQRLLERVYQVAKADTTVLVTGETGTGKELIARMIHEQSQRSGGPLIIVNCASFSESILESELFGHEKGAFTGADKRRIGAFERARGGTLFLDEIGEMSLACQAKILRVLEHYPFERVGGSEPVIADCRIVAATHRNLAEFVEQERFRADLMYRLQVIELKTPPLRERIDDIVVLADHFIRHFCRKLGRPVPEFSDAAMKSLQHYHWPGNVRELRNMMERIAVLCEGSQVGCSELCLTPDVNAAFPFHGLQSIQEMEHRYIEFVLGSVNGNKSEACRILGISRATLYNKLGSSPDVNLPNEPVVANKVRG